MALVALAILLLLSAAAEAARPKPVGHGLIATDDVRYAVFTPASGGALRLMDTETGSARQLTTPPGFVFRAVGGGQVLWGRAGSAYQSGPPLLTDVVSGVTREPAGWESVQQELADLTPEEIGGQWMAIRQWGNHFNLLAYLNWRTGEWFSRDPGPATSWPNLDRPDLMEPMCSPFRRREPNGLDNLGPWLPFEYQRPYATYRRGARELLGRCGSRRRVTLFRAFDNLCATCGKYEDFNSLLPWRPVWAGRGRFAPIRAYLPRRHRTVKLATMRRAFPGLIQITQTRTRIFVLIRDLRVYSLPAPHG